MSGVLRQSSCKKMQTHVAKTLPEDDDDDATGDVDISDSGSRKMHGFWLELVGEMTGSWFEMLQRLNVLRQDPR